MVKNGRACEFGIFIAWAEGMAPTTFYITINIKTTQGYECIGKFQVGDNRRSATNIFRQLKGGQSVDETSLIQFDLMESSNGLPVNVQMISCSLEDVAENCRIITKELFRLINIDRF